MQTARLAVEAAIDGKAPGPYTARALSGAETALTSIATHIGAVQPPTTHSRRLRRTDSPTAVTRGHPAQAWRTGWLRNSVISVVMLVAGVWLFIGGWIIGYPFTEPTVDARLHEMIVGVIVFLTALARLLKPRDADSDLLIAVAGGWLIAAPFVLSYGDTSKADAARVNDVSTGGLLVVLALLSLALWLRSSASRS